MKDYTEFELDHDMLQDVMTDYSNKYGDQKLIDGMLKWLETKMGSKWLIINKED
jgi:hypothetical protein